MKSTAWVMSVLATVMALSAAAVFAKAASRVSCEQIRTALHSGKSRSDIAHKLRVPLARLNSCAPMQVKISYQGQEPKGAR